MCFTLASLESLDPRGELLAGWVGVQGLSSASPEPLCLCCQPFSLVSVTTPEGEMEKDEEGKETRTLGTARGWHQASGG